MSLLQRLHARTRKSRGFASFDGLTSLLGVAALGVATLSGVFFAPTAVPSDDAAFLSGGTIYFETSDTFDKGDYPGLRAIRVQVQGAGGGSGSADATASGQQAMGGSGGGGGYAKRLILASDLGTSETVTVGAGGAAGTSGGNGGAGGDSSFTWTGGTVLGAGGAGGANGGAGPAPSFGVAGLALGGNASGGDLNIDGGRGDVGIKLAVGRVGGNEAGTSFLSSTHRHGTTTGGANGAAGLSYGGGALPAINDESQAAKDGGVGGAGIVIVELLY